MLAKLARRGTLGSGCALSRIDLRQRVVPTSAKHITSAVSHEQGYKFEAIKVIGICGSLRDGSFAKQALQTALAGAADTRAHVELIDLNDYNLYFCDGLENESKNAKSNGHKDVIKLKEKLRGAKGIILATPEYHNSFSGVLKNALDLCGFEDFEGKIIGLVAVSGGAMGGVQALNGLREIFRALHAWVIPEQASVPQVWRNIDDPAIQKRLRSVGRQVATYAHLHSNERAKEFLELIQNQVANPGGTPELDKTVAEKETSAV